MEVTEVRQHYSSLPGIEGTCLNGQQDMETATFPTFQSWEPTDVQAWQ